MEKRPLSSDHLMAKERRIAYILLGIGFISALLTILVYFYEWFEIGYPIGIATGCLGGGFGIIIAHYLVKKKPELKKDYELQNEERNVFIRGKAKGAAYDVIFYTLCAALFSSSFLPLTILQLSLILLGIAFISFVLFLGYYSQKY